MKSESFDMEARKREARFHPRTFQIEQTKDESGFVWYTYTFPVYYK